MNLEYEQRWGDRLAIEISGKTTVSDRIEIDPCLEARTMRAEVLHEICRHALEVAPEECCGFVLGDSANPFVRSVRIPNLMTKMHLKDPEAFPRDAKHAYYMSEVEYQKALDEAESRSEFVSAVYHSHVEQACYLSPDDLAFAVHPLFPFPEASQIVVSLLNDRISEVGIFDRVNEGQAQFVGHRLEPSS